MKLPLKARKMKEQRGSVIVFTALSLWFLLTFVAFGVDFANYYSHRTRLQNAADAAALAGVVRYAESPVGRGILIQLPSGATTGQVSQLNQFNVGSFSFSKDTVPTAVRSRAEGYVQNDYGSVMDEDDDSAPSSSGVNMENGAWGTSQEGTTEVTMADGKRITTTITPKGFCYGVDLEDTVNTIFARIFGVQTLPVQVSALAMLDGTQTFVAEEVLPNISSNLNDIIPNYYWETITKYGGKITDSRTGQTENAKKYGENNPDYLTAVNQVDLAGYRRDIRSDNKGRIVGYQEPSDGNGIVAEPIYADSNVPESYIQERVWTLVYDIDNDFVRQDGQGRDILGLFLDRDNITTHNNPQGIYFGSRERFTEINLSKMVGYNPEVPLYARIESEPICVSGVGGSALTVVHSIDINVLLTEAQLAEGKVKPFVLAYDGPDPNRTVYDAPWIWTGPQPVKIKTYSFNPGQIQSSAEPVLSKVYNNVLADIPQALVQTSVTTPGPIEINIPSGHVFYGAIFAPRSQITIRGGGKIHGFIAARRIIQDTPGGDRTFVESQEIEMASLAAYKPPGAKNDYFDYTRNYIKDNYNLVYTEFVDWTDKKYLPH